jgi:hypothetical protein
MDPVLLILDLEERFGIVIPDEKAERMLTVGDLYLYVLGHIRPALAHCPTGRAFYHLRQVLAETEGVERARVRPAAALRDVLPPANVPRLAVALGLPDIPDADPPPRGPIIHTVRPLLFGGAVGSLLLFVLLALLPRDSVPPIVGELLVALATLLGGVVVVAVLLGGRYLVPVPVLTVRDIVIRLVARPAAGEATGPATLWADVAAILAKHSGVPADAIRPEHSWWELERMRSQA